MSNPPLHVCLTLDLEPDHAGRVVPEYEAWRPERVNALLDTLSEYDASLTAFVVGQSVVEKPEVVAAMRERGVEFHLHSYSHDLARADAGEEIDRGSEAFSRFFGSSPTGYRAPEGRITAAGAERLRERGFAFDSSVFPSIWPHPRYATMSRTPFRWPSGLLEIPVATATAFRLPVTLSFMKLLGWPLYSRVLGRRSTPNPLVFDLHLHDLFVLPAFGTLPGFLKVAYSRNRTRGFEFLRAFLGWTRNQGARFVRMSDAAQTLETTVPRC